MGTSENFSQTFGFHPDGFREVFADFGFVNFERGYKFNVSNVVAAVVDVHESGDGVRLLSRSCSIGFLE